MSSTITSLSPNVEIVNVTSRRRWTIDEKVRMVEETFLPGASVSAVARRNGVNPNMLYKWRKFMDDGGKAAILEVQMSNNQISREENFKFTFDTQTGIILS